MASDFTITYPNGVEGSMWEALVPTAGLASITRFLAWSATGELVEMDVPIPAALEADAGGQAGAAGTLRVGRDVAAGAGGQSGATGKITQRIPLSGEAEGEADAGAQGRIAQPIAGQAGGHADGAASVALPTSQPLSGQAGGEGGGSGAPTGFSNPDAALGAARRVDCYLDDGTMISIGLWAVEATCSSVVTAVQLGGAAAGAAGATATGPQLTQDLAGQAGGQAGADAGAEQAQPLAGTAEGHAGAVALEGSIQELSGAAGGRADAGATPALAQPLAGGAGGQAGAGADGDQDVALRGTAGGQAALDGALTQEGGVTPLAGVAEGRASGSLEWVAESPSVTVEWACVSSVGARRLQSSLGETANVSARALVSVYKPTKWEVASWHRHL